MFIEKLHGLRATSITLDERFTILSKAAPQGGPRHPRRRASVGNYFNNNNTNLIEQLTRRLEQQAMQHAVRYRLGFPGQEPLRRFGSESSLPGLRRANSYGNLSQMNSDNRFSWKQSNGNLSRSGSFGNLSQASWRGRLMRGFRRRGGGQRAMRGRFRGGGRQGQGRVTRVAQRLRGAVQSAARGVQRGTTRGMARGTNTGTARPQTARRGNANWARGRGGATRSRPTTPIPTKEELDLQLDQYMAGTKAALDAELDEYMKNAMDFE